ncbi:MULTISPECIES: hypothetical protein [unclassified Thermosynechococcus]|uniref:hypothetical protein n=1 Tax=unclassified Thermosynechococcus TaxID=2622553 RepID=UPI002873A79D|nr:MULTISPECIES: hypothetical protein [unclassified Thermosynechococcus]WNC22125.1 hypothetical protein RHG98_12155 [Thermosynechococcus sp. PP22]WNC32363.1 hypothetical protein RHH81_12110 [Thermosynechococcus sp. PKX95]WNC34893.1 hypothetical protein RHH79_12115 [Thermosynechococcus sp. PKX91]WNC37409.1 hypothetical protein RHI11_12095 [Thermosynechococcus sp. WL11]WNC39931.1 hypothetical protein RHI18_12100 [Thermosynechococcus sp. WL17]
MTQSRQERTSRQRSVRWYMGFKQSTKKLKPKRLIEVISRSVQSRNLVPYIPLLRIEKEPKGEYYFFIAIESIEMGDIPPEVDSFIKGLKEQCFNFPVGKERNQFTIDDIKPMVGAAHDVQDYTNPIPYRSQKIIRESPFALVDSTKTQNLSDEQIRQFSTKHEHLLYWLSASGSGTWESFKKTCEILDLHEPKRILRRLKLLNHLTTSDNGSKWQVNPPSLVHVGTDSEPSDQTFLLHGQRSHCFLQRLREFGSLKERHQPRGEAPPRIKLILPSQITIEILAQKIGYSINLAESSSILSLNDWQNSLNRIDGVLPFNFDLKRFDGANFIDCIFQNETGFYQFWTKDSRRLRYNFFYNQNTQSWLQGDWYGLRFLAILSLGQNVEFYYNRQEKTLAIPRAQRLPEIYESHLVMASGMLPTYRDGFLIYTRISSRLAREISEALKITLTEQ